MNNCNFVGRLTHDPELKFIQGSGMAVVSFMMAVEKQNKKKLEAEGKPTANFLKFKAFGKTAEAIANYVKKGHRLALVSSVDTGSYEKEGVKHYTTDFIVNGFTFIESSQGEQNQSQNSTGNFQAFDDDFANDFKMVDDEDAPF